MSRIQRGRGGWVAEAGGLTRAVGIAMVIAALAIAGCSSKKNTEEGSQLNPSPNLMGQEGLNGSGGSPYAHGSLGGDGTGGPLSDIHFDLNEATIEPQDNGILKANADWLSAHPNTRVQIEEIGR